MTVTKAPRGIAFDLDGVLVDSTPCHRAAFEEVFRGIGITDFDYSSYAGWRTPEVVEDVLRNAGFPVDSEVVSKLAQFKSRLARELIAQKKPFAPGLCTVLESLASPYRLALATSGSRSSVESFLEMSGTRALFSSVLCGEDVVNAKPDPEIYSRTRQQLGVSAADYVVVEDALAGVQAGRAANATVIGIAGTCSEAALRNAGATRVIHGLGELAGALSSL